MATNVLRRLLPVVIQQTVDSRRIVYKIRGSNDLLYTPPKGHPASQDDGPPPFTCLVCLDGRPKATDSIIYYDSAASVKKHYQDVMEYQKNHLSRKEDFCKYCGNGFKSSELLKVHVLTCAHKEYNEGRG